MFYLVPVGERAVDYRDEPRQSVVGGTTLASEPAMYEFDPRMAGTSERNWSPSMLGFYGVPAADNA